MKDVAVYVHYPFCVRKCAYCDFLSAPGSLEKQNEYIKALLREIEGRSGFLKDYRVKSLYFGGGTPTLMPEEGLTAVMNALANSCGCWPWNRGGSEAPGNKANTDVPEATIEANPGTVTAGKAAYWRKLGFNRVSLGMQSANASVLGAMGRIHTSADVEASVRVLRKAGFRNLSVDLIVGYPGDTPEGFHHSLEEAVKLSPEHISCYSLSVEEGTVLSARLESGEWQLPSEETERSMYDDALRTLEQAGYRRYEISNFSRPGFESRHNMAYWDLSEYIGLGLGASSYLGGARLKNTVDLKAYCKTPDPGKLAAVEQAPGRDNDLEEFMFLGLRRTEGVSEAEFRKRFGTSLQEEYGQELETLVHEGLLVWEDGRVSLTRRGLDLANVVFEAFLK